MKLPDELLQQVLARGDPTPTVVVRSLYDIAGNVGETWAAGSDQVLWLFSRPLGQSTQSWHFRWGDLPRVAIVAEGLFTGLEIGTSDRTYRLRFGAWDRSDLDRLVRLWQQAPKQPAPPTAEPPFAGPTEDDGWAGQPEVRGATPLVAFCASMRAMMEADAHVDAVELRFLARVVDDAEAIARGVALLAAGGVDGLLARVGSMLTPPQRRCLIANLIALAMEDGVLRSREQELLERFRRALSIEAPEYQEILEILMLKDDISVYTEAVRLRLSGVVAPPNPLMLFCAALELMMRVDGAVTEDEREVLARLVQDVTVLREAEDALLDWGEAGLVRHLQSGLDARQRRCLVANLVAVAMADGALRSREQDLLDRIRSALAITDADYELIYEVLMTKNNLSVFA